MLVRSIGDCFEELKSHPFMWSPSDPLAKQFAVLAGRAAKTGRPIEDELRAEDMEVDVDRSPVFIEEGAIVFDQLFISAPLYGLQTFWQPMDAASIEVSYTVEGGLMTLSHLKTLSIMGVDC